MFSNPYQKARILSIIDDYHILTEKHVEAIKKGYNDSIYYIKTIEQYSGIQQTKSYASVLWLYGQFLSDINDLMASIRYLEESKNSFEEQSIEDQQYYQCVTLLGAVYLRYYEQDRQSRQPYLKKARAICHYLLNGTNSYKLKKAYRHAIQLQDSLRRYGPF